MNRAPQIFMLACLLFGGILADEVQAARTLYSDEMSFPTLRVPVVFEPDRDFKCEAAANDEELEGYALCEAEFPYQGLDYSRCISYYTCIGEQAYCSCGMNDIFNATCREWDRIGGPPSCQATQ